MRRTVSIITTFYNAERFIAGAFNSVVSQIITDKDLDIEYVVVNDHSTDNSLFVFNRCVEHWTSKFGGTFPKYFKLKLVTPDQNLGCGGARKFGIENSTGRYLMFLDADDYYIHTDFVQRAVRDIEKTQADLVEYGLVYNMASGNKKTFCAPRQLVFSNPIQSLIALFKDNLIKFNVWTKIMRRTLVSQYEYSTKRTFEDVETIPVWVSLAKKIVVMPTVEINYRANSNSIIRDKVLDTRLGTIHAIASHFERFKDHRNVLIAMYIRAIIDLTAVLDGHSSEDEGFNEMSELNTYMLSYIYPKSYKNITFNLPKLESKEKENESDEKENESYEKS